MSKKPKIPKITQFNYEGLRVILANNKSPFAHVCISVLAGSFAEEPGNEGYSHFLEHMLFKGTSKRSYVNITEDAGLLGADQNADTSNDIVNYFLNLPSKNIGKGLDLLLDMFFNSAYDKKEIDKERGVILEELKMYEDDPNTFYYDYVLDPYIYKAPLDHPVIGYRESLANLTRESLVEFRKKMYALDNTYLIVVGDITAEDLVTTLKKYRKYWSSFSKLSCIPADAPFLKNVPDYVFTKDGVQQTQLSYALPGVDERTYLTNPAYSVALNAFGGGMYSVLFESVREDLGLCYNVNSFRYQDNSLEGVNLITTLTEKEDLAREAIINTIASTQKNGISKTKYLCAKASREAGLFKRLDSSIGLASLIKTLLDFREGTVYPIKDYLSATESLTHKKVEKALQELISKPGVWVAMRPAK